MTTYDRATASEEGDLSAAELADVCEALIAAWHLDVAQSGQGAAPRSASALDVFSIRKAFPQGMPPNLEYAHGHMAGQMVDVIMLQLQSVVTLLRADPMVPLGVWSLVRSELEYAGRVAWLLEPFPGEAAGTRRVRAGCSSTWQRCNGSDSQPANGTRRARSSSRARVTSSSRASAGCSTLSTLRWTTLSRSTSGGLVARRCWPLGSRSVSSSSST